MATFDISSRPKVPKPSGKAVFSAKHDKNVTGIDNVFSKLNDEIAWRDDITHVRTNPSNECIILTIPTAWGRPSTSLRPASPNRQWPSPPLHKANGPIPHR